MNIATRLHETFVELGIAFEPGAEAELIAQMIAALERSVGEEIESMVSRKQRRELYRLDRQGDLRAIDRWFDENAPFATEVVDDTYALLLNDFVNHVVRDFRWWNADEAAQRVSKLARRSK